MEFVVFTEFCLSWTKLICVSATVAEMVHLEQTSPSHRAGSRDSDDMGDATPTQVKACTDELFKVVLNKIKCNRFTVNISGQINMRGEGSGTEKM